MTKLFEFESKIKNLLKKDNDLCVIRWYRIERNHQNFSSTKVKQNRDNYLFPLELEVFEIVFCLRDKSLSIVGHTLITQTCDRLNANDYRVTQHQEIILKHFLCQFTFSSRRNCFCEMIGLASIFT